ncbi:MAG TPA: hypothetical protein VJA66_18545, partial [Thermoanaerobaculia bacterium]
QAILFPNGKSRGGWLLPVWAALAERWDLPGGRQAVDRVLRDDYLRGLQRALHRTGAGSASHPSEVTS